jgi:hypothetical protein
MARMLELHHHDLSFRTAYAQAKELALAQGDIPLLTAGSLQTEERAGAEFVYRYRYDGAGKRVTEYLGPADDDETAAKIDQALGEIADCETLARYSRDLRRIGFYGADNSTLVTVAALFNSGIFGRGAVLVGTHAFGAIMNELGVAVTPFPMTEDVDVARAGRIQIAALPKGGFLNLLKQTGLPFLDVPQLKHKEPPTSFRVRGQKLKVDLLVPARGAPYRPVAVPELGAHATGLPHFAYLLAGAGSSVLLGRDRIVPVVVPHPGRFCVHKLAVYSLRSGHDNPKREKDAFQAALIAKAAARQQEFLLNDAISEMDRGLRAKARAGARRVISLLEGSEAAALIEPLAR